MLFTRTSLVAQYIAECLTATFCFSPHSSCWFDVFSLLHRAMLYSQLGFSHRKSKGKRYRSPNIYSEKRKYMPTQSTHIKIFISLMFRGFICCKYLHRHFQHTLYFSIVLHLCTKHNKREQMFERLSGKMLRKTKMKN